MLISKKPSNNNEEKEDILPSSVPAGALRLKLQIQKPKILNEEEKLIAKVQINGVVKTLVMDWDTEHEIEFRPHLNKAQSLDVSDAFARKVGRDARDEASASNTFAAYDQSGRKKEEGLVSRIDIFDVYSKDHLNVSKTELCLHCGRIKEMMVAITSEIREIDSLASKEIDLIQRDFEQIEAWELSNVVGIVHTMNKFSQSFIKSLENCFKVLPHHANYFEKLLLIFNFLSELQVNRSNEVIAKSAYQLEELRLCNHEELGLKKHYNTACLALEACRAETEGLKGKAEEKEAVLREEISALSNKIDEILASDGMLLSNMQRSVTDVEHEVVHFLCDRFLLTKEQETILKSFLKRPDSLNIHMFRKTMAENGVQTEKRIEGKFAIMEHWRIPFQDLLKFNWKINTNKEITSANLRADNYLTFLKEVMTYFAYVESKQVENFIPKFSLVERNVSKFHQVLMDYLLMKERLTNAVSAQYMVTKLDNLVGRYTNLSRLGSFWDNENTSADCSTVILFTKFLREDYSGDKPIEVKPVKDPERVAIKNLQEIFAKLLVKFNSVSTSLNPAKQTSLLNIQEKFLSVREAFDYFFRVFDISQGKDVFPDFVKKLLKQNIVDPLNKTFSKAEKFRILIAAQISFKYNFSNVTPLEYVSKVLKRIMSKENTWEPDNKEDTARISSDVRTFQIKENNYFISEGEEFSKERHFPRSLIKANKLLKSYHKNVMKAKYEEEQEFVFLKEITDSKLGEIFNCLQVFVNCRDYFNIDDEEININCFLLRELRNSDAVLNSRELMNVMKPYLIKEENYRISSLDVCSLICELVQEKFETLVPKRDLVFKQHAQNYKGGLERNKIREIIKSFDFKNLLRENEIESILYEIEMTKISKAILYEKNTKEQSVFFETVLSRGPVYYTLKDLEPVLGFENLIRIYKRSLLSLEDPRNK